MLSDSINVKRFNHSTVLVDAVENCPGDPLSKTDTYGYRARRRVTLLTLITIFNETVTSYCCALRIQYNGRLDAAIAGVNNSNYLMEVIRNTTPFPVLCIGTLKIVRCA